MWLPNLPTDGTPIFQQILASLERSIRDGLLPPGERLPPQRALAEKLGVSVGTVTRAYEEADRRGLTVGHVGRGTYIAYAHEIDSTRSSAQFIDLSLNVPPMVAAERLLVETWGKVRRRTEFSEALNYGPVEGLPQHRRLIATWLTHTAGVETFDADRVVVTGGGQASMDLVFQHLCRPGEAILAEALTFAGMRALSRHRGYRLIPVAMDSEGLLPDSVAALAEETGARVLYTMPTLQNPTASTLSAARRESLIEIARRHQLTIVEDDVYAVYVDRRIAPAPLVNLAPEITYYVSGLSKSLAPGLRTGFVIAPSAALAAAVAVAVRATCFSAQSMGLLIAQQAIEDGAADQIIRENRQLLRTRGQALRAALGLPPSKPGIYSPHVWLPSSEREARRLETQLLHNQVRVMGAAESVLDARGGSGLRFCVGATRRNVDFERALSGIHRAVAQPPDLDLRAAV
jgi:DNA-binding transcriptional MocR family regulator